MHYEVGGKTSQTEKLYFDQGYEKTADKILDSLNEDEYKSEFRSDKRDIYRFCSVFEIPQEIRHYSGMVFDKEETLCIFLNRFVYPCKYQDFMLTLFRIWLWGGGSAASSTRLYIVSVPNY